MPTEVGMIVDRNSPIPQYFQLQNWLMEQIELGIFKPGERIPTEEELVNITGLCRTTIRQAINNLSNLGYLERKRRFGTFVLKRSNKNTKNNIIGILVPDIRSGCIAELARGAEDEAAKNRHSIILCNTDDLFFKAEYYANKLVEDGITGVVFVPIADADEKNRIIIQIFQTAKIPIVLADRILPEMGIDYVTSDNVKGGYEMTRYLLTKGHRRIIVLLNGLVSSERFRLDGYKKALLASKLSIDDSLVYDPQTLYSENFYSKYVIKILAQRKEHLTIFAAHDRLALLFYALASEKKLSIPDDISLVGYDDLPEVRSHPLGLTTVHQPIYEMGRKSIHVILSRLQSKKAKLQQIVLKSYLVERHSVKVLR
jgi:DNA-binding LacI/PurR family transcriptional regulator